MKFYGRGSPQHEELCERVAAAGRLRTIDLEHHKLGLHHLHCLQHHPLILKARFEQLTGLLKKPLKTQ